MGQDPLAADGVFAATLEDGTHISAEALRRGTCDSGMVVVSDTGQGMTVGRRPRSIPSAMRWALMNGQVLNTEAPAPMTEDVLVWLREWTHECGVDVGPDSNLPLWDGTQPDYDWAISALLRAA